MVFSCLKCNARYRIDDERLKGKVLRFTCHKCNQTHLLRDPAKGGETVTAVSAAGSQPAGQVRRTTTSSQARAGDAKPTTSMPTVGRGSSAARRPTTRTGALPQIPTERSAAKAGAGKRKNAWFAIRKGKRIGPMHRDRIIQLLREGHLHERSFMWRPTMPSWLRMNKVPELQELVTGFTEWKAGQYDRTVVRSVGSAQTPTPSRSAPGQSPPPLPDESSGSISFADAPRVAPTGDEVVDSLYSGISQPSIDIRKAHEVQPEEPEIPDADEPPPLPATPAPSVAPETTPAGQQTETAPSDDDLFPTDDDETSSSAEFFNKAQVLPAGRWPPASHDDTQGRVATGEQAIRFGEAAAAQAAPPPKGGPATDTRLEDFSVMVRLSRQGRKHKAAVLGTLGVLIVGGIGLALYLALTSDPVDLGIGSHESGAVPVFKQKLYAVIKHEPEKQPRPDPVMSNSKRRVFSGAPRHASSKNADGGQLRKPAAIRPNEASSSYAAPDDPIPVTLGKIDPHAQAEFKRYAGILSNDSAHRQETTVDVKPHTMTKMPKHNFDKSGMDAFLATKMRKFSDCKRRMTRRTDMPVKVGLSFSIGLDGRVRNIQVDQAGGEMDEGLDACIRRVVGGWAFPPPDEAATYKSTLLL
ncbi:MAG: DUF4339 domain-containing protein [Deltaproteobacteria bacterium]|nr:DUF4339 domain-containing protein [Deltaproteobacteria bacterium]